MLDHSSSLRVSFARRLAVLCAGLLAFACQPPVNERQEQASVPVRSEVLVAGPFQPRLKLLGKVVPAVSLPLRASHPGKIRYPAKFASGLRTGELVKRGELLFEIENDDARLRLAEAELTARLAEGELTRTRQGVEGGILSMVELKQREVDAELAAERLKSARLQSTRLRHLVPRDGHLVVEAAVAPGSEIQAGDVIAELAGNGLPRIEAWVAAGDLDRLQTGLAIRCLPSGGDRLGGDQALGLGVLGELARQVDRSGTVRLMVDITEDSGLPLPGEGLELEVLLAAREAALSIPWEGLINDGGVSTVFVLEPSGSGYKARSRLVRSGLASDGRVEILDGLKEGERIAVRGAELLADGLSANEADAGAGRP